MRKERFIVTKELGKLAKWLRILGFDTIYYSKGDIAGLIIRTLREERVILTRSAAIAKYKGVRAVVIRSDHVEEQLEQAEKELRIQIDDADIFRRCVECNQPLEDIDRQRVKGRVPGYVFETQETFKRCPACDKIFWKGTHWDMVQKWLDRSRRTG